MTLFLISTQARLCSDWWTRDGQLEARVEGVQLRGPEVGGGVEEGDYEEEKGAGVLWGEEERQDAHQGGQAVTETKG